jgi:hypothetical protein
MKVDSLFIITVALVISILCGVIYLQHVEITQLIAKAGAQNKWAQAIEAVQSPIDHMYLETRGQERGVRVE